tara:strand:- start:17 stop:265 length:249 start_codon:yes stop_codon:yes gene_type:complete
MAVLVVLVVLLVVLVVLESQCNNGHCHIRLRHTHIATSRSHILVGSMRLQCHSGRGMDRRSENIRANIACLSSTVWVAWAEA